MYTVSIPNHLLFILISLHLPPPKGASIRNAERDLQTPRIPPRSQPPLDRAPTDSQGGGAIDRGPLARLPLTEARKSAQFLALAGRCDSRTVIHEDRERGPVGKLRKEAARPVGARIAPYCSVYRRNAIGERRVAAYLEIEPLLAACAAVGEDSEVEAGGDILKGASRCDRAAQLDLHAVRHDTTRTLGRDPVRGEAAGGSRERARSNEAGPIHTQYNSTHCNGSPGARMLCQK